MDLLCHNPFRRVEDADDAKPHRSVCVLPTPPQDALCGQRLSHKLQAPAEAGAGRMVLSWETLHVAHLLLRQLPGGKR